MTTPSGSPQLSDRSPLRVVTTDSYHYITYTLVRALRRSSEFVGLLYSGGLEGIVRSRYVDAAARLELPRRIPPAVLKPGATLTSLEKVWLDALISFCERNRADVFLPTSDYEFYLAAARFRDLRAAGIAAPVAPLETVRVALDKQRSTTLAHEVGVPAPKTRLVSDAAGAPGAAAEIGYPVVVKPRLSLAAFGVSLARDESQLAAAVRRIRGWASGIVLQEYVPGSSETSVHGIFDRDSRPLVLVALAKERHAGASLSTVIRTIPPPPETDVLLEYLRRLGIVGPANVQLKVDSRTGANTFVEVNARWGANARMWTPMAQKHGINPALSAVDAARGVTAEQPAWLPPGLTGASPIEDLLALKNYLVRRDAVLPENPRVSPAQVIASYLRTYVLRRPSVDVFWSALPRDPVAVLGLYKRTRRDVAEANADFIPLGSL